MVVVDASGSMAYPEATLEKWHHARRIALGLAAVAHRGSDPVGLAVATERGAVRLPLRTRRGVVHEMARALRGVEPGGSPDLSGLLASLRGSGRLVIVSDMLSGKEDGADPILRTAAHFCAAGREVFAIHVLHPLELDPPARAMRVVDPERSDLRRPLVGASRRHYLERFAEWREMQASAWRQAGANYVQTRSDEPTAHAVRRIVRAEAAPHPAGAGAR